MKEEAGAPGSLLSSRLPLRPNLLRTFRAQSLGFRDRGLGIEVEGLGFGVGELGFRVQGLGFRF